MTSLSEIEAAISQLSQEDVRKLAQWIQEYVQNDSEQQRALNPYPLRGTSIEYLQPFESVAEEDWNACS